jgi:hypothetical protein
MPPYMAMFSRLMKMSQPTSAVAALRSWCSIPMELHISLLCFIALSSMDWVPTTSLPLPASARMPLVISAALLHQHASSPVVQELARTYVEMDMPIERPSSMRVHSGSPWASKTQDLVSVGTADATVARTAAEVTARVTAKDGIAAGGGAGWRVWRDALLLGELGLGR